MFENSEIIKENIFRIEKFCEDGNFLGKYNIGIILLDID